MTLFLLLLCIGALAYANGANDNFKAVATLYGSSTLSYRASLAVATAAQLLGSVASVVLAGALLRTFGGKGLVPEGVVADPTFLLAVGGGAAVAVLLATRLGFPISTTHALLGGLTGAGLAIASNSFAWSALGPKFAMPLLISPFLALAGAALLYPVARSIGRRLGVDAETCFCVGEQVEPVAWTAEGALIAVRTGVRLTVAESAHCTSRYTGTLCGVTVQRIVDGVHLLSGSALGFARGLNDTPKVMALLVAAAWSGLNPRGSLVCIALAMALGGVLHSRRIARTMGRRITAMNPGQGLLANLVASGLVIGASVAGSPVSTTHVSTGAIFGIGLWTGRADWRVVTEIILAWIITLPVAAGIAYAVAAAG